MSIYGKYKTDENKEVNGVMVEFDGFKLKLARAGGHNQTYTKALERETKPFRRAIQNGSISVDIADQIVKKVYAETIILGWEGVTDETGKELPFNKANAHKLLTDLPELFNEVKAIVENMEMFRQENLETEAKN